jgi:hypothetical protein
MISLLNFLEKVVEKIVADIIAVYYKTAEVLHTDQIRSQRHWSALDAVSYLIQKVHNI